MNLIKTFSANNLFISPFVRVFSRTVIKISFLDKSAISTDIGNNRYYPINHHEVPGGNLNYYENRMDTEEHIQCFQVKGLNLVHCKIFGYQFPAH